MKVEGKERVSGQSLCEASSYPSLNVSSHSDLQMAYLSTLTSILERVTHSGKDLRKESQDGRRRNAMQVSRKS